ncbi:transcription factor e(y)2-domain-containing protein [Lipomyces orientalis]|uniref:Transcription factor e(Y)2-domain-containing protein n=1 Tax=Lipomyces orientalis TaxID=1233043 RepID=A0ACC3TD31_9ASCO
MADEQIRAKVNQKLIESGEYERLSQYLRQKLIETGWYDQVTQLAFDSLRTQENPNFDRLIDFMEPKALALVPEHVKVELLSMIKRFLEGIVDK